MTDQKKKQITQALYAYRKTTKKTIRLAIAIMLLPLWAIGALFIALYFFLNGEFDRAVNILSINAKIS